MCLEVLKPQERFMVGDFLKKTTLVKVRKVMVVVFRN